ncbi:MAG: tyrosine-type recombinase/integrase [Alphaproteobacteria bacterium]|nr:tyrosine-type recombinase/integrase [Alphaproteobacteria bacterium]
MTISTDGRLPAAGCRGTVEARGARSPAPTLGSPESPAPRLAYLQRTKTKGVCYAYYRRCGRRLPITDQAGRRLPYREPLSAEWLAAYERIHRQFADEARPAEPLARTFGALIADYLTSRAFTRLARRTKADYRRHLAWLQDRFGKLLVADMPPEVPYLLQESQAHQPRTADYRLTMLRLLLGQAVRRGWRADNPAASCPPLRAPRAGHRPWEETEIAAFRRCWAPETVERLAFELMLNTGQRGGDIVRLRREQIRDGWLVLIQGKTGQRVELPVAAQLLQLIGRSSAGGSLLRTRTGKAFTLDHFRKVMRAAYRAAGLPDSCTSHGLRYAAATRLHEVGCDWQMIAALTGHRTVAMVRKYTDQRRLARLAVRQLERIDDAPAACPNSGWANPGTEITR